MEVTDEEKFTEEEFERFYHKILGHSEFRESIVFLAGSTADLITLEGTNTMRQLGLNRCEQDVDFMNYSINEYYVFSSGRHVPASYGGKIVRIDAGASHPGYTKLVCELDKTEHVQQRDSRKQYHGPAKISYTRDYMENTFSSLAPHVKENLIRNRADIVEAVHSPYWPDEASEWVTRTRHHASPSKSVIKQVVRYGCDFVCVSHKLSPNKDKHNEWRFSFSMAERIIIRNWTDSQRIVYRVLRLIHKMIEIKWDETKEKVLCTYYFKTLMLWACEERAEEFWSEHSLVDAVRTLLIQMTEWLTLKHCPNYFIPANNMLDHLTDTDLSADINALREKAFEQNVLLSLIGSFKYFENLCHAVYRVEIPYWLYTSFLLVCQLPYAHCRYWAKHFNTVKNYSDELKAVLTFYLRDIFRGIMFNKEALYCKTKTEMKFHVLQAKEEFRKAIDNRCLTDGQTVLYENIKRETTRGDIVKHLQSHFIKYDEADEDEHSKSDEQILFTISRESLSDLGKVVKTRYVHCKGISPTVHIAWFIAQAYLANLLYTAERDYAATVETCDKILDTSKLSDQNRRFAQTTFPVVISTEWSEIFDSGIQAVIGFYSLCSFIESKAVRRSVYLGVCPVHFALYLKQRCAKDKNNLASLLELAQEYTRHDKICASDSRVCDKRVLLTTLVLQTSLCKVYL